MAIETPVDVLRRLREQRRQEQVAKAEAPARAFREARTGKERASAFGQQIGQALAGTIMERPDLEQDPAVLQAKTRQKWLGVDPGDTQAIKGNIKAAVDAEDYEVANYLTNMYYKTRELQAAEAKAAAAAAPDPYKSQSREDKLLSDADEAERRGDTKRAALLRNQAKSVVTEKESEAQGKQMEQFDKELAQSYGIDLESDLKESWYLPSSNLGTAFQYMRDSARDRSELYGDKVGTARRDMEKYITYDTEYRNEFLPSKQFIKEYDAGKTDYMYKDGQVFMGHVDDKGNFKMISRIPLDMIHDDVIRADFSQRIGE